VSSQFFTGLLYALSLLDGPSEIISTTPLESVDYINMTIDAMARAGIRVEQGADSRSYRVFPGEYKPFKDRVEADWSQAGFWYAAAALGSGVEIDGMNAFSVQGDMVVAAHYLRLTGEGEVELDVSGCPDLVPPLAVMAAVRRGNTNIVNAARLRIKESDRLASVTAVLTALGADIQEHPDSLTIRGKDALAGGVSVDCHNDHRIAMMAAIAATRCEKLVTLVGAECVNKSYPDFWEHYRMLGGDFHVVVSG
jgi:3-phosphoshikimate 1-carboxyvinyltransferase